MMAAFKPGYQLHAQFLLFQSFANNGRWRCKWHVDEDKGVDDFLHDTEDNDNGYEDEAIICCRHSYKCMYLWYTMNTTIHAEPNCYDFQFKQWYMLTATISLQIIATWGVYYLSRIPVQIILLNEGYHYQTQSLFEVKTGWVHWCAMTMVDSLCHQSSSIVG